MNHAHEVAYISGAITSDPNCRQKFADAEMVLDHLGYSVLNPTILPDGLTYDEYMAIDLRFVEAADTLVMLPDWIRSHGAPIERNHALKLGKRIIPYLGLATQLPSTEKTQEII